MITDIIIGIIAMVLDVIHFLLSHLTSLLGFVIPDIIQETWITLFSYAHGLDGIFPVTTGYQANQRTQGCSPAGARVLNFIGSPSVFLFQ